MFCIDFEDFPQIPIYLVFNSPKKETLFCVFFEFQEPSRRQKVPIFF
jgi:hypothetical protein